MYPHSQNQNPSYPFTPTSQPAPRPHPLDRNFRFPPPPPPPQPHFAYQQAPSHESPPAHWAHTRTHTLQINPDAYNSAPLRARHEVPPLSAVGGARYNDDRVALGRGSAGREAPPHAVSIPSQHLTPAMTPPIGRAWTLDYTAHSSLSPLGYTHGANPLTRSPLQSASPYHHPGPASPAHSSGAGYFTLGDREQERRVVTMPSDKRERDREQGDLPQRGYRGARAKADGPPKAVLGGPGGKTFDEMLTERGAQTPQPSAGGLSPSPSGAQLSSTSANVSPTPSRGLSASEESSVKWNGMVVSVRMPHPNYSPPDSPLHVKPQDQVEGEEEKDGASTRSRKEAFPWPETKIRLSPEGTPLPISPDGITYDDLGEALSPVPSPTEDGDGEMWNGKKVVVSLPDPDSWESLNLERARRESEREAESELPPEDEVAAVLQPESPSEASDRGEGNSLSQVEDATPASDTPVDATEKAVPWDEPDTSVALPTPAKTDASPEKGALSTDSTPEKTVHLFTPDKPTATEPVPIPVLAPTPTSQPLPKPTGSLVPHPSLPPRPQTREDPLPATPVDNARTGHSASGSASDSPSPTKRVFPGPGSGNSAFLKRQLGGVLKPADRGVVGVGDKEKGTLREEELFPDSPASPSRTAAPAEASKGISVLGRGRPAAQAVRSPESARESEKDDVFEEIPLTAGPESRGMRAWEDEPVQKVKKAGKSRLRGWSDDEDEEEEEEEWVPRGARVEKRGRTEDAEDDGEKVVGRQEEKTPQNIPSALEELRRKALESREKNVNQVDNVEATIPRVLPQLPPHLGEVRRKVVESQKAKRQQKLDADISQAEGGEKVEVGKESDNGHAAAPLEENPTLASTAPTSPLVTQVAPDPPSSTPAATADVDPPTKRLRPTAQTWRPSRALESNGLITSSMLGLTTLQQPKLRPGAASFAPRLPGPLSPVKAETRERGESVGSASVAGSESKDKGLRPTATAFVPPKLNPAASSFSFNPTASSFTFAYPHASSPTAPSRDRATSVASSAGTGVSKAELKPTAVPFVPAFIFGGAAAGHATRLSGTKTALIPRRDSVASITGAGTGETRIRPTAPVFVPSGSGPIGLVSGRSSETASPVRVAKKIRPTAAVFIPASMVSSGGSSPVKSARASEVFAPAQQAVGGGNKAEEVVVPVLKPTAAPFVPVFAKKVAPSEDIVSTPAREEGRQGVEVVMPFPSEEPAAATQSPSSEWPTSFASTAEASTAAESEPKQEEVQVEKAEEDGGVAKDTELLDGGDGGLLGFRDKASPRPSVDGNISSSTSVSARESETDLLHQTQSPPPHLPRSARPSAIRHEANSYLPRDTPKLPPSDPAIPIEDIVIHPSQPVQSHHTLPSHVSGRSGLGSGSEKESLGMPDAPLSASTQVPSTFAGGSVTGLSEGMRSPEKTHTARSSISRPLPKIPTRSVDLPLGPPPGLTSPPQHQVASKAMNPSAKPFTFGARPAPKDVDVFTTPPPGSVDPSTAGDTHATFGSAAYLTADGSPLVPCRVLDGEPALVPTPKLVRRLPDIPTYQPSPARSMGDEESVFSVLERQLEGYDDGESGVRPNRRERSAAPSPELPERPLEGVSRDGDETPEPGDSGEGSEGDYRRFTEWIFPLSQPGTRDPSPTKTVVAQREEVVASSPSIDGPAGREDVEDPFERDDDSDTGHGPGVASTRQASLADLHEFTQSISPATANHSPSSSSSSHHVLTTSPASRPRIPSDATSVEFPLREERKKLRVANAGSNSGAGLLSPVPAALVRDREREMRVDSDSELATPTLMDGSGVLRILEVLRKQGERGEKVEKGLFGLKEGIVQAVEGTVVRQHQATSDSMINTVTSILEEHTRLLDAVQETISALPNTSIPSHTGSDNDESHTSELFTAILSSQHAILTKFDEVASTRLSGIDDLQHAINALQAAEDNAHARSLLADEQQRTIGALHAQIEEAQSSAVEIKAEVEVLKQRLKDSRHERDELRSGMEERERRLQVALGKERRVGDEMDRLVARTLAAELERDALAKAVAEGRDQEERLEKEMETMQAGFTNEREQARRFIAEKDAAIRAAEAAALAAEQSAEDARAAATRPLPPPPPAPATAAALAELGQTTYSFQDEVLSRMSRLDDEMHESMGSRVKEYENVLEQNRGLLSDVEGLRVKLDTSTERYNKLELSTATTIQRQELQQGILKEKLAVEVKRREETEKKTEEMREELEAAREQSTRWQIEVAGRQSQATLNEIRLQSLTRENAYWREFALGRDRRQFKTFVASKPFDFPTSSTGGQSHFQRPALSGDHMSPTDDGMGRPP
ncbi:hypothetical protein IAT38_004117 [Cryptococcus sp. DSM 104549]